jgi:Tol biopolymer transport system component
MPDLREVFQMSTQKVRPDRGFTERQEFRQRRKTRNQKIGTYVVVAAVGAVAVIALASAQGGGSGTTVPGASAPPSAAAPVAATHSYVDIATGERAPVAADLWNARVPEVSPDLSSVVYEDSEKITVAALDGSERETITPKDLDGYLPTWIDDETILFQGRPAGTDKFGGLYVADVSSGELTKVADLPARGSGLPWWTRSDLSPDGRTLLYHLPRHEGERLVWDLWTVPLAGGRATLLREDAGWGTYAPDGSIVFFDHPVNFGSSRMSVMDGDGSNSRTLVKFPNDEERLGWLQVSPDGTMVFGLGEWSLHLIDIVTGEELAEVDGYFPEEEPTWYGNDTLIVD